MKTCPNCTLSVDKNYCSACGQQYLTVPFTFKTTAHWITGLFDWDKGFFLTLYLLFARPGKLVNGFLQGQTRRYTNPFNLLLLTVATFVVVFALFEFIEEHLFSIGYDKETSGAENGDLQMYFLAAVFSISIYLANLILFRKTKKNANEHLLIVLYEATAFLLLLLPSAYLPPIVNEYLHLFPEEKEPMCMVISWLILTIAYHTYFLKGVYGGNTVLLFLKSILSVILAFSVIAFLELAFKVLN